MEIKSKPKKRNGKENKGKPTEKSTKKSSKEDYYCPLCTEKYGDTTEVWIECSICKSWWHEACSSYEEGTFTCDICAIENLV